MMAGEEVLRALRQRRQGAVLAFSGPAGVGKTYAARALLRQAAVPTLEVPAALSLAEWPARLPAVRTLPGWAEAALRRLPDGDGAVAGLAALLAAAAPLGVLVDDLHDAPTPQHAALTALAGLMKGARGVALLFTTRHAVPPGIPTQEMTPLDGRQTAALVEQELGPGVPPEVTAWVQERALGNPLFTLEFLRYLARSGHLYSDGQRWHWRQPDDERVPGRIEALIELALQRAGAARGVLEARATVPDGSLKVWARVADLPVPELRRQALVLEDCGLLRGGQFTHPLYPEVLRSGLDGQGRRTLARRALHVYRADPLRAVEFLPWAELPPAEAVPLLQAAAAQAGQAGRARHAGTLLAQASDLSSGAERAELALQAAETLQATHLPRALELARRALADATPANPALSSRALPIAAIISARTGGRQALEELLAGWQGWPAQSARLQALQIIGDHAGVLAEWQALSAEAQAQAELGVQYAVTVSLMAVGRSAEAEKHLGTLLAAPRTDTERLRLQSAQVMLLYHQGQYAQAARIALDTARELRQAGNLLTASALHHNGAAFLRMQGDFGAALDSVRLALDERRALGDVRGYASSLGLKGELELERGQLDAAEDALTEALGVLNYLDDSHFLLNNLCMLTYLYTLSAAPLSGALALHHAGRALALARRLGNARLLVETLADASRAHTRAADPQAALHLIEEAAALAAALAADQRTVARNHLARGLALEGLGRLDEAVREVQQAEQIARTHQGEYEANRVALELARLRGDQARLKALAGQFEAQGQGLGALLARRYQAMPGQPMPTQDAAVPALQVLGPLCLQGQPVRGERRRALLLRLLGARLAGRSEVTRLDLTDDLYHDQDEARALGALKQTVAALRAAHGRDVILTTPAGYALGAVQSDAEQFLARPDIGLWRGPLPIELGETAREALLHALRQEAQAHWPQDPAATARAGRLLLDSDPLDEPALRLTLQALRALHQHRTLKRVYAAAQVHHAEVGAPLPASWQAYLDAPGR